MSHSRTHGSDGDPWKENPYIDRHIDGVLKHIELTPSLVRRIEKLLSSTTADDDDAEILPEVDAFPRSQRESLKLSLFFNTSNWVIHPH